MPNTTNFNWTTPADTDLVKDGAAAIRTLGSSIDTSFVDLKGGTTGQLLSKASNTDLDYTWTAAPTSGSAYTLISTTNLSGTATTVTGLNSNKLKIMIIGERDGSGAGDISFYFNGVTTGTDYTYGFSYSNSGSYGFSNLTYVDTTPAVLRFAVGNDGSADTFGAIYIDGANGTSIKQGSWQGNSKDNVSGKKVLTIGDFIYASTTPITSFTLTSSTTMTAGSIRIYGA